ncbi:MAG: hypothetical protein NC828_00225, partial [Candidatus Omnitrophica bacterium]|nr:hypothetical protein [Candidatus Omnitrophota bacterium]
MKKAIITLSIPPDRPISKIAFLNHQGFADYCEAEHIVISVRKFYTHLPVEFEKIQVFEIGLGFDVSIYVDEDTLFFPKAIDFFIKYPTGRGQFYASIYPDTMVNKIISKQFNKVRKKIKHVLKKKDILFFNAGQWITDKTCCSKILVASKA